MENNKLLLVRLSVLHYNLLKKIQDKRVTDSVPYESY